MVIGGAAGSITGSSNASALAEQSMVGSDECDNEVGTGTADEGLADSSSSTVPVQYDLQGLICHSGSLHQVGGPRRSFVGIKD
jgi:ubiquitin C-terminal hydrolase